MKPFSYTYRFFSTFLAFILLLSMSMPAGLHAKGDSMDMEICDMGDQHGDESDKDDCPMHSEQDAHHDHQSSPSDHHDHKDQADSTNDDNCDLGFACACSAEQASVKAEAVPVLSKMQVQLPVSGTEEIVQSFSNFSLHSTFDQLTSASLPPLFLLNSTFLN